MRTKLYRVIAYLVVVISVLSTPLYSMAAEPAQNQGGSNKLSEVAAMSAAVRTQSGGNVGITLSYVDGKEYLFLPAAADYKKVIFNFNTDQYSVEIFKEGSATQIISGEQSDISGYLGGDIGNGSRPLNVRLKAADGGVREFVLYVMKSANIASMYISSADPSKGRGYIEADKNHRASGSMVMINSKGSLVYSGGLAQIKGRGNTSFRAAKKPYQIKLQNATDLIQTSDSNNADKTWVLLANAWDPTMIHTTMAFKIAKSLGLNTPNFRAVDIYYDGTYCGNYLLCEKVEIGKGRVPIKNLEKANEKANEGKDLNKLETAMGTNKYGDTIKYVKNINNPENIEGGYLVELDIAYYQDERSYFILSDGTQFVVKSPTNCSKEQMEYISDYFEEMLQLAQKGGKDPETGASVWDYIDKQSFVKYFVMQEIVKNADVYASSTYLYKDAGAKLISGPVWDFDDCYGVREDVSAPSGIVADGGWILAMLALPDVRKEVKSYYRGTAKSKASAISIDKCISEVSESQKMNRILWNNIGQYYDRKFATYEEDCAYMKNFARERFDWLSSEFAVW